MIGETNVFCRLYKSSSRLGDRLAPSRPNLRFPPFHPLLSPHHHHPHFFFIAFFFLVWAFLAVRGLLLTSLRVGDFAGRTPSTTAPLDPLHAS